MAITLNGTTGITTPDISTTAQSTDITTTGDISAVDLTASGGLYLGGTAAANYLDDYEEGTWTPAFSFANGNAGVTYTERSGKYTKIGRQVVVEATIILSSKGSSTGRIEIAGLPFTATLDEYTGAIEMRYVTFTQKYAIVEVGRASGTYFRVMLIDSGANSTECADTNVANNSGFLFTATYFV